MRNDILSAIEKELRFQDDKYPDSSHTLGEWVLLIEAELEEAKVALIKGGTGRNSLRSEIIQVAALCVACLNEHGVNDPHEKRQI